MVGGSRRPYTPRIMVYGETGCWPFSVMMIEERVICCWRNVVTGKKAETLTTMMYKVLMNLYIAHTF